MLGLVVGDPESIFERVRLPADRRKDDTLAPPLTITNDEGCCVEIADVLK